MNKELFKNYASIQAEIKQLQDEAAMLKDAIAKEMEREEFDEVKTEEGTFYFMTRKSWTYPKTIQTLEKSLKEKKKEAEIKGTAKFKENKSLAYRMLNEL